MSRILSIWVCGLFLTSCLFYIIPSENAKADVVEEWVASYNGLGNDHDYLLDIAIDASGDIYVTGGSTGLGTGMDYMTLKYDQDGNLLWEAKYNSYEDVDDLAFALAIGPSGNIYITGQSDRWGNSNYTTISYDPWGNVRWIASYDGPVSSYDGACDIVVDSLENVYITGTSSGNYTQFRDYTTISYDSLGNLRWLRRYNGPGNHEDEACAMTIDMNGNIIVTGRSMGTGDSRENYTGCDWATVAYDTSGNEIWVARYTGPERGGWDGANAIAVDNSSGNIIVTGGSGWFLNNITTVAYDSNGNELWVAKYSGDNRTDQSARSIAVDQSGNIYVTGNSYRNNSSYMDYTTIKYDSNGNELWVARFEGYGSIFATPYDLCVDLFGNVYVTGYVKRISPSNYYAGTIKYDTNGNEQWIAKYNDVPHSGPTHGHAITLDTLGNVYVAGWGGTTYTPSDSFVIKYSQNPSNQNQPPVANAGYDQSIYLGEPVLLDGSYSYDADGYITSYIWDFGDGTIGYGKEITHKYGASGNFTVTLTVTDNEGATDTDSTLVTVIEVETDPPNIIVEKIANVTTAKPGDLIEYMIYYNNTGTHKAGTVWINDMLPNGLTYISSSAEANKTGDYNWTFHDVEGSANPKWYGPFLPSPRPPKGTHVSMVYDSMNNRVVLFGGTGGEDETWEYDTASHTWYGPYMPTPRPSGRCDFAMAYDSANNKVILFGGQLREAGLQRDNETWEYDTATHTWSGPYMPSNRPSARAYHAMTFDSTSNRIVLFGGYIGPYELYNDETWEYDSATHTWYGPFMPTPRPSERYGHGMAYDSTNEKVILFGGTGYSNDIWEYYSDSHTWAGPYMPSHRPSKRIQVDIAYNSAIDRIVMFGGSDGAFPEGTWEYDTTTRNWYGPYIPTPHPAGRKCQELVYDSKNDRIVTFGGGNKTEIFDDTWEYVSSHSSSTNYFTITARVNSDVPSGTILTNTVTLDYTDSIGSPMPGSTASADVLIIIDEQKPPIADAGSNQIVFEGDTVYLDGAASYDPDGTIISYEWDFGDGTTGSGQLINHIYGDDGVFEVTLTVTDDDGLSNTTTMRVTVNNIPPTILDLEALIKTNFTLRVAGEKWHNIELYIYEDDVEIGHANITRYPDNPDNQSVTISNLRCNVKKSLTAVVFYTPEDDPTNGQSMGTTPCWIIITYNDGTFQLLHHVFNAMQPETWKWIIGVNQYLVGHMITFIGPGFDPGSDDLTFTWDFGDGTLNPGTIYYNNGLDPDPYPSPWGIYPITITDVKKHIYSETGNFIVILTVTDDDGGIDTYTTTVILNNEIPNVCAGGPYFANQGSEIAFTGIHLGSAKSATPAYIWYFGDGESSTSRSPMHIYANGGTFIVSLVITDEFGEAFSDTCYVHVNANPIAEVIYDQTAYVGDVIEFDGSRSYDPDGEVISYNWDFDAGQDRNNDGNYVNDADATQSTVKHVFDMKGEYEVTFTISDGSTTVIKSYLINIIENEIITEPSENSDIEKETSEDTPDIDIENVLISEKPVKSEETNTKNPIPETENIVEDEPERSNTIPSKETDKENKPDFPISSFTASVCSLIIAMISLSMPLYMKIRIKDLLKNPKRKSIYQYIMTNPGDNFTTIKQSLSLTNGVLSYHLKILEREKFIISDHDGGFKRFYLSGKKEINNAKRINGNQRIIFDILNEFPGISQTEIAKKIGTTVQVVNYHIKRLLEDDLIRIEMTKGHKSECYPKNLVIVTPI